MKFTFGIVTKGNDDVISKIIDSIELQKIPTYEIIIVGSSNLKRIHTTIVPFDETQKASWITRKKNIITDLAKYENIVYLHDYITFEKNWYKGQLQAGEEYKVRVDKIQNKDGSRGGDWLLCPWDDSFVAKLVAPTLSCLLPYSITHLSKYMYISGAYFIAKKTVMKEFPFNELLSWGESDDIEWSRRVREVHDFQINTNSCVCLQKQKDMPFKEPEGNLLNTLKQIGKVNKKNKFKIIVPSFNNQEWVEYNLASILNQTYTEYEVLYVDDASTDSTYEKVKEIVGELPNWNIIKNVENKGAAYNYVEFVDGFVNDNDILIHLDGDDWLHDDTVLEQLNNFYNERNCWMSYGGFVCWDGGDTPTLPYPQSTAYPDFVHTHKLYRKDEWRASHLRTFRGFLFKAIQKNDLRSLIDNEYYWHASDLSWQYPALEMCPKDKIGVVDFYTAVYNHTPKNQVRTHEREDKSNAKYEAEIRNRKRYKEGLSGEKLPQVNVFNSDYYFEYNNIPTKFTYCYQQVDGEFDMTVLCDPAIMEYLEGRIKINRKVPIVARLFEQRDYFHKNIYNAILENYDKFDAVLTFDRELLARIPNAVFLPPTEVTQFNRLPNPHNHPPYKSPLFDTYELPEDAFQVYPKSKLVSAIVSSKAFLPGHVKRLEFIKAVRDKIDLFGRGMGKELPSKLDGLREYMFSIAIENISCDDNYFSEKIIDCFLTGTVPIYHGCVHIHEFFDKRGILSFNTQEELDKILDELTQEKYESMLEYVKINYDTCFNWPLNNDMLYENYYKKIIQDGTTL